MMSIELMAIATPLKLVITDIYNSARNGTQKKLKQVNANSAINSLYKKIDSVQKVKTIWQVDKEVRLNDFYYPSRLIIDDADPKRITSLSKIPYKGNFVIEGTVGQGKSIFLRYLCSKELKLGSSIPVFAELRKYDGKGLVDFLVDRLIDLGIDADKHLFNYLAKSGTVVFLLDGFDEIHESERGPLITQLESICERFEKLRIIITARPNSDIQSSPYFRVLQLAPLLKSDWYPFITKTNSKTLATEICEAIKHNRVGNLLTTPLLLTLLIMKYRSEGEVPSNFSEFYENLFHTLLTRHDKSKPGFKRERKCEALSEKQLQELFESFCFLSYKDIKKVSLSHGECHEVAEKAIKMTNLPCGSDDFVSDVSNVACLLIEEGLSYNFVHKSLQEFYAARFVHNLPDSIAKEFYDNFSENWFGWWHPVIVFLSEIDSYRCAKYLRIPRLRTYLEENYHHGKITDKSFIKGCIFVITKNPDIEDRSELILRGFPNIDLAPGLAPGIHDLFSLAQEFADTLTFDDNKDSKEISLYDLSAKLGKKVEAKEIISRSYLPHKRMLEQLLEEVKLEEEKRDSVIKLNLDF